MRPVTEVITWVGALTSVYLLKRFVVFVWLYFVRPSSVQKFLHGPSPYAVITGASDGIGKAVALELYETGFNLILHGRNEAKLTKVIEDIKKQAKRRGDGEIKYFIASADSRDVNFEKIVDEFRHLNVTLLFNNVGGGRERPNRVDAYSEEDLLGDIRVNALFSFYLTRAFLPQMRSTGGPTEVIFVGSQSADIRIPRLYTYAPCKAFLYQLTRCFNSDERYWTPTNVHFMYLAVGTVITNSLRMETSLFYPTASKFAKSVVHKLGCGRERVTPYAPHAIQQFFAGYTPAWFIEMHGAKVMKKVFEEKEKRAD
ncbi:NAD(P)-binding protein [Panus rudis PR-1116 ss-1]|nr:NAD(P)-binding protein [Panus rudis PR-1116 ss-1]